jgi:spermidine synthase
MICQNIWVSQFTLIFGVHLISSVTLLAVFIACFAAGIYLFRKFYSKSINYFLLIAVMQTIIAAFIALSPWLIKQFKIIYLQLSNYYSMGPYSVMFIRITASFLYFFIPAGLIGGSFILLFKLYARNLSMLGRQTSVIIGWFITGLAAGIIVYNFVLIRFFGIFYTSLLLAIIVIMISLTMFALFLIDKQKQGILHKFGLKVRPHSDEYVITAIGKWKKRLLRFLLLSSFSMTSFIILWKRILTEFSDDKTIYFSTVLLFVFLLSLASGNFLITPFIDKFRRKFTAIAVIQLIIGITAFSALGIFINIFPAFARLNEYVSWLSLLLKESGLFLAVMFIPFCFTGCLIPLYVKTYAEDIKTIGHKTGLIFLLIALGICAAFYITSFILIPILGIYKTYLLLILFHLGIGIFIFFRYRRIKSTVRIGSFLISAAIFIIFILLFNEKKISVLRDKNIKSGFLEKRIEGSTTNIEIHKDNKNNVILYINGEKAVSSDPKEIRGDKLLSYIPYLFKPDADKVLIIGLGIGITAKTMADLNIHDIEIVEISPEVTKVAANAYAYVNDNILVHENVSIFIEDGRSFLFRSKGRYDIIICNAAHPRINNALYTEDYYKICRDKISDNGYLCQWMPFTWMSENEFWSLIRSCTDVFPYTTLWYISPGQALLLASKVKQEFEYCYNRNLLKAMENPPIYNIKTGAEDLMAMIIADDRALRNYARNAIVNTDNKPIVQFSRYLQYSPDNTILRQFAGIQVSFDSLIRFNTCADNEAEIITILKQANIRMKEKLTQ